MPIVFPCGACQASIRVSDAAAGKRGRCPKCQAVVTIPAASPAEPAGAPPPPGPPASKEARMRAILDAFVGEVEPTKVTWTYRLGLGLVTAAMVALPIIYIGIIAAVVVLIGLYAVHGIEWVGKARSAWAIILGYAGPLIAGAILVFFMVKPLFARQAKAQKLKELGPTEAPLLFALVTRVARAVGAPEPQRIDLDCQVNASAGFEGGLGGLFGQDLVLTIGLPLLSELTVQQLAGVIAHELGHFAQGAGMRLSFVVRSINMWFARVVYERDDWDESLVRQSQESGRLALIFLLARLFVFLTRAILWVLMMVGHAISCFLMRQMEYDADRYEIRLAGSACFADTMKAITLLDVAGTGALYELIGFLQNGQLPDDFAAMVRHVAKNISPKERRKMEAALGDARTGLLDTHPAYADRVANAEAEDAPGVFHLDWPASQLFDDFPRIARSTTQDFYRAAFGSILGQAKVVPTAALLSGAAAPDRKPHTFG